MIIAIITSFIGLFIVFSRYNFVAYIIGLEIILLGANMNFLFVTPEFTGIVLMVNMVLLVVAAIETTIGLTLIVNLHKLNGSIEIPITGIKG